MYSALPAGAYVREIRLSFLTSRRRLDAYPPPSTSKRPATSTPADSASTLASDSAIIVAATTIWLHALASDPEPIGPRCRTVVPIDTRAGHAATTASSLPPAMIASVPVPAPSGPPETGASTT